MLRIHLLFFQRKDLHRRARGNPLIGLLANADVLGVDDDTVLAGLRHHVVLCQEWKILSGLDVADVLGVALGEDDIDLLQAAAGRLGVCVVDDGEEDSVESAEEQVGAPTVGARVVDEDGRDHDDEEIPQPVADGRAGGGLGPGLQRVDLGRIQPGQG